MIFYKFILIPVWLLTLMIQPFLPKSHPWRHRQLTLQWWAEGATDNALYLSVYFWICAVALPVCWWVVQKAQ